MSLRVMAVFTVAGLVSACSPQPHAPPAFTDTTGEAAKTTPAYPAPPYGFVVGSTIQNLEFIGYPAPQTSTSTTAPIRLSDFYNPHGRDPTYSPAPGAPDDRDFPPGSPYGTGRKPVALLIEIASVWCGPCNDEAKTIMPVKHSLYSACGGEFLVQLADGATPGAPATPQALISWDQTYQVDHPSAIDPSYQLEPFWQEDAYPEHIAIDTTTMKIAAVLGGEAYPGTCDGPEAGLPCKTSADCTACIAGNCTTDNFMNYGNPAFACCANGMTSCASGGGASDGGASDAGQADAGQGVMACPASTCQPVPFWTTYESLLDKTRTGCMLH